MSPMPPNWWTAEDALWMLARHCGTREAVSAAGGARWLRVGARPVQTERASMPMYYANPDC
ncbi:MAG: hypothetical protein ACLSAH_19160 [Bilophila wadsworthia]